MDELNKKKTTEEIIEQSIEHENDFQLYDFTDLEKESIKVCASEISKQELRFLIGIFYQIQKQRIACGNQIYAITHSKTECGFAASKDVIQWHYDSLCSKEKQLSTLFKWYCKTSASGLWMSNIKGIGPTFTNIMLSHLNIEGRKAAGQFHSICGLNDNNKPWYGRDKAAKIVDEVLDGSKTITFEHLMTLSEITGRSVSTLENMSYERTQKTREIKMRNGKPVQSVESLKKGLAMIPYNAFLKKTCYLISDSFVKNSNRGSLYGELYLNRKAVDTKKNEEGAFAEQAKRALDEHSFQNKDILKCYRDGKLPPLHIENRARRYAVKLFISHLFEQMWIEYHGTQPPTPYILEYSDEYDHNGYIEPEVPYIWG